MVYEKFVAAWKNKDIEKNEDISSSPLFNRATNGLYSPASTIKPLLGLLSLQEKKNPYRMMYAGPHFSLPNSERKYRDWKKEGHGYVDLNRAIVQSCDVYFYQLAYDIGIDKISNFLQQFFIGQKTGVDMPTEASGINPSKEWKKKNINDGGGIYYILNNGNVFDKINTFKFNKIKK